jgi:phosphatidylglycerophosphate synthase
VVVVSRDLMLSLGVLVIHVAGGTVHPSPSWIGKLSTVFQMATVLAAMISAYFGAMLSAYFGIPPRMPRLAPVGGVVGAFAWVTALLTVASGLQYMVQGLKQINPPTQAELRS